MRDARTIQPADHTIGDVYLIHFSQPYHHARHYLGWAQSAGRRFRQHQRGKAGAKLTAAVAKAGIKMKLARVWSSETRDFERQLKRRHNSPQLCPICNPPTSTPVGEIIEF